jgi:hypothetical protein
MRRFKWIYEASALSLARLTDLFGNFTYQINYRSPGVYTSVYIQHADWPKFHSNEPR